MPKRVLASQFKNTKTGSRNRSFRTDYGAAFDVAKEIFAHKERLKEPDLSDRERNLIEEEKNALEDMITRGKSRIAAERHRKVTEAARKILQKNKKQKRKQMTRADLIRDLKKQRAHLYTDAKGSQPAYNDRRLREILDLRFDWKNRKSSGKPELLQGLLQFPPWGSRTVAFHRVRRANMAYPPVPLGQYSI